MLARLIVERACGLVAEKELGVFGKGACDGDALLLAAGKLRGKVAQAICQAHLLEHLRGVEGVRADLRGELHVFKGREVGDEVVELKDKAHVRAAIQHEVILAGAAYVTAVNHDLT